MNELTQSLLRQVWIEAHGTALARFFAHFECAVQDRYWSHTRATVGTRLRKRAMRLARRLWTYPERFDPDDPPCDNCSILLSDMLSCHYFWWWLDRHSEWQLDLFTEQDLFALGGCPSDAQLTLW